MKNPIKISAVVLTVLLCVSFNVSAAVSWTNPSGSADSFTYSNGGSNNGHFGDPNIVGDTFSFSPDNFRVEVSGDDVDMWDTMSVTITALTNRKITGIQITESGDYEILGSGLVNLSSTLTVTETDSGTVHTQSLTVTPSMPIDEQGSGSWQATGSIDGLNEDRVTISLRNGIYAQADAGSISFIQKKEIGSAVAITIIPEPVTAALLSLGALGLFRRKKSTQ